MNNAKLHGWIKAGVALVAAIAAALVTAATGKTDFSDIDTATWLTALGVVLASGALTAFVQNVEGVAGGIIKAVIGAFGAAIAVLVTAYDDNLLSAEEKITAVSAFVAALALVYQIPDSEPEPMPAPTTKVPSSVS
jgi:hypothetical protein